MSLQQIQSKLKAPKSQYNNFGKYNYRSLEDILEGLKPILAEYKYSNVINDKIVQVGERIYVKATVNLVDEKGNVVASSTAYAREPLSKKGMDEAQVTGSSSSYARKYAMNGLYGIDDTKDADSMKPENGEKSNKKEPSKKNTPKLGKKEPSKEETPKLMTEEQRAELYGIAESADISKEDFGKKWNLTKKTTYEEATEAIKRASKFYSQEKEYA